MGMQIEIKPESGLLKLCRFGGSAAFILLGYSFVTMLLAFTLGGSPDSAEEIYIMLQDNRLVGLIRLEILTLIFVPFYFPLLAGIYAALRKTDSASATLATTLAFIGVILFLSSFSTMSLNSLSDKYASATTEAQKTQIVAAGEAIIALDMWHSTSAFLGGILMQGAVVWLSILMLRSDSFNKLIAYLGILIFGLDLIHILIGPFLPETAVILMIIAGTLYLAWFPLIGIKLIRLGKSASKFQAVV